MKRYYARGCFEILEQPFPLAHELATSWLRSTVPLSAEAQRLWMAFHDHVEKRLGAGGELEPVRGLANKLPEHARASPRC